jgi:hypothetical protein
MSPDALDALLADAVRRLDEAAGGAAVCTFTRAGIAVPGIKYAEGRWAALRELQRERRRAAAGTAPADLTRSALLRWRADLDRVRSIDAGPDWLAYRHGGTDALAELLGAE